MLVIVSNPRGTRFVALLCSIVVASSTECAKGEESQVNTLRAKAIDTIITLANRLTALEKSLPSSFTFNDDALLSTAKAKARQISDAIGSEIPPIIKEIERELNLATMNNNVEQAEKLSALINQINKMQEQLKKDLVLFDVFLIKPLLPGGPPPLLSPESAGVPECFALTDRQLATQGKWNGSWNAVNVKRTDAMDTDIPITVALIDTGIDRDHPALKNVLWINQKEVPNNGKDDDGNGFVDDVHGFNFAYDDSDLFDLHGHGTYSAGILAARSKKNGYQGVNPHVRLMVLRVTRSTGRAWDLAVAKAIRYATKNGARIVQVSLCLQPRSKRVEEAIAEVVEKNVLVLACANSHSKNTKDISPASSPGVITVGACDNQGKRAPFSGWGAHLDVVAPGIDITGLRAKNTDFLCFMSGKNMYREPSGGAISEELFSADGSCSALPQVTGIASLIWQRNPKLSAEEVRRKILMGCDDLHTKGWDRSTGYGRINFQKALKADPSKFLQARITGAKAVRRGKEELMQILGQTEGAAFRRYILQIAFGTEPKDHEWKTVGWSQTRVSSVDGALGRIPLSKLDQRGRWSVRCLVQDREGNQQESRGTISRR